jgi:hypothetical protein
MLKHELLAFGTRHILVPIHCKPVVHMENASFWNMQQVWQHRLQQMLVPKILQNHQWWSHFEVHHALAQCNWSIGYMPP